MAYRMKMFKSQKPSSFDLRVSDFKRIPGFNYVLSVSTEARAHVQLAGSGQKRKHLAIDAEPRARQRAKRKFQRRAVRRGLSGHITVVRGRGTALS